MFDIGSDKWPGISKIVEEAGELLQVCGKLIGSGGVFIHWDGSNLYNNLHDEIGDVLAAVQFVVDKCKLDLNRIYKRRDAKLARFNAWRDNAEANQKAIK